MGAKQESATLNVHNVTLESLLDSKIPELILVIPVYQKLACASHDLQYMGKCKNECRSVIPDSGIFA